MTKEEFEAWRGVKQALTNVWIFSGPITINNYILYTANNLLSAVLELDEEGNVVDGYTTCMFHKYKGKYIQDFDITIES